MDDNTLLADIDLSQYSEADRQLIAQNLYLMLEDRVGEKVSALVSDDKFDQFEVLIDQADDEKLDEWLDINVPNYDQLVSDELAKLKNELSSAPASFLKSADLTS